MMVQHSPIIHIEGGFKIQWQYFNEQHLFTRQNYNERHLYVYACQESLVCIVCL